MDGGPSHGTLLLLLGRRGRRPRPSKRATPCLLPIKKWKREIIGETRGWLRGGAVGHGRVIYFDICSAACPLLRIGNGYSSTH